MTAVCKNCRHSRKYVLQVAVICGAVLLAGCSGKYNGRPIDVSASKEFIIGSEWAVVTVSYVPYCAEPGDDTDIHTHGRKGDILNVLGRRILDMNGKQVVWYKFQEGWISESNVSIYQNRMQAERSRSGLVNKR